MVDYKSPAELLKLSKEEYERGENDFFEVGKTFKGGAFTLILNICRVG
jgi:hypothetical protein